MNKYFNAVWIVLSLMVSFDVLSQHGESIRSDRPGISIAPFTPGKGILQIQSGFDYSKSKQKSNSDQTDLYLSSTQFRYGLMERLEFNSYWLFQSGKTIENNFETKSSGFSEITLGARYLLMEGFKLKPAVAMEARFNLPVLSDDFAIDQPSPRVIVSTHQELSDKLGLTTNWAFTWGGDGTNSPSFLHTVNLSFPLSDRVGAYVEYYGTLINNPSPVSSQYQPRFDGGIGWLLTRNLQLDLHGGIGSSHGMNDFFVSSGISWRSK